MNRVYVALVIGALAGFGLAIRPAFGQFQPPLGGGSNPDVPFGPGCVSTATGINCVGIDAGNLNVASRISAATANLGFSDAGVLNVTAATGAECAIGITATDSFRAICLNKKGGLGASGPYIADNGGTLTITDSADITLSPGAGNKVTTAQYFNSSIGSGSNAFAVATNGARIDFGAGASDYASSDGTTVTFAAPVTATRITAGTMSIVGSAGTDYIQDNANHTYISINEATGAVTIPFALIVTGKASVTSNATTCTLNGGSPSTCTATVTAGAVCQCTPVGTTAAIAAGGCAVSLSSTTLTATSANGLSNVVNILCDR